MNKCISCEGPLSGRQTKFCSPTCKNARHQSYESQQKRGLERKAVLVQQFGGECVECGYKKNLAAMSFHHNKGAKAFPLYLRSLSNRSWTAILKEAKKCILLCANCHMEKHYPHLLLPMS